MTDQIRNPHRRRWGHRAAVILLTLAAGAVATHWAWNAVAVELFALPAIGFKHALAVQAALAGLCALPLAMARCLARGTA